MNLKSRPDSGKVFFIQKMASRYGKAFFTYKKWLPGLGNHFFCSKMPVPRRERHMKTLFRVLFRDVSSEKL